MGGWVEWVGDRQVKRKGGGSWPDWRTGRDVKARVPGTGDGSPAGGQPQRRGQLVGEMNEEIVGWILSWLDLHGRPASPLRPVCVRVFVLGMCMCVCVCV